MARTIAVLAGGLKKQHLADVRDHVQFIDFELRVDVLSTLDEQILLGTGEDEDFEGIFFTDGVQVQEFGGSASASIRRAAAKVEARGYRNSAIILNPVDYAELELKLNTAGGEYRGNLFTARAEMRAAFGAQSPSALALVKLNADVELPTEAEEG